VGCPGLVGGGTDPVGTMPSEDEVRELALGETCVAVAVEAGKLGRPDNVEPAKDGVGNDTVKLVLSASDEPERPRVGWLAG
jgi:hypothetical protein